MSALTARIPAGRTERHGLDLHLPTGFMDLGAHDIASALPAAILGIVQKGLLDRAFQDSLYPEWIFPNVCDVMPWVGNVGDEKIWTRTGLMTPTPTPVTPGAD